jgi:hypothetical protein
MLESYHITYPNETLEVLGWTVLTYWTNHNLWLKNVVQFKICYSLLYWFSVIKTHGLTETPDDGDSKDLWNVGKPLPDYMVLQPRRQPFSETHLFQMGERSTRPCMIHWTQQYVLHSETGCCCLCDQSVHENTQHNQHHCTPLCNDTDL